MTFCLLAALLSPEIEIDRSPGDCQHQNGVDRDRMCPGGTDTASTARTIVLWTT